MSRKRYADVAQLVEHNLAKVGVASSNLVIRSKRAQTKTRGNMVEWLSGPKQQPAKLSNHGFKSRLHLQVLPLDDWRSGSALP